MAGLSRRTVVTAALATPFINRARAAEGSITFAGYNGIFQDNYRAAVVEPFLRANPGIKLNYYAMTNSAETLGILRAQKAAPQTDVAMFDVTIAKAATEEGLLERLGDMPVLSQLAPNAIVPGVAGAAMTFDNLVLLYAPDKVKPAPTSWKVLWDKQYADEISMPGVPDIVGVSFTLIANKVFGGGDYRTSLETGLAAVAQMAPGVLSWDPHPDPYTFIINGTAELGVGWNARGQLYSQQSDGRLAVALPDEGSLFQVNMMSLVKGSQQTDAAKAFIAYALGTEAQKTFTERMFYAPTNTHAPISAAAMARTAATPERMARMLDVNWMEVAKLRDGITEQWRRRILNAH
jgi:putative spermidine/putrescine transport system substrate-binding protein